MKFLKLLPITLFILFSSLTNITYAESLTFAAATYEGDVKKGKAHGVGVFTFSDGSTYLFQMVPHMKAKFLKIEFMVRENIQM